MRLGIDITPLQTRSPGGIGVATYHTLRALADMPGLDIVLYGRSQPVVPFSDRPLDLGLEFRPGAGLLARAGNIAWLQYGLRRQLEADGVDVFWGTRHVLPRNARRTAMVATLYDFWYARHPEQQPAANLWLNRLTVGAAMRDGDVLTAISDATADEARALFPASARKVRTVHLGVDPREYAPVAAAQVDVLRERIGVSGPFVLALDVHNPRKRFSSLLEAAARIGDCAPPFQIVATGAVRATARDSGIAGDVERLGLTSRVTFLGDVAQPDLLALYTGCSAFVYPSEYEGFGMPVLEAMACGAPVVCSNASSVPEVAGDAALMFDPASPEQFAAALVRVLGDPDEAQRLRDLGRARAATFTWEKTAAGMRAAFDDALAARRG